MPRLTGRHLIHQQSVDVLMAFLFCSASAYKSTQEQYVQAITAFYSYHFDESMMFEHAGENRMLFALISACGKPVFQNLVIRLDPSKQLSVLILVVLHSLYNLSASLSIYTDPRVLNSLYTVSVVHIDYDRYRKACTITTSTSTDDTACICIVAFPATSIQTSRHSQPTAVSWCSYSSSQFSPSSTDQHH